MGFLRRVFGRAEGVSKASASSEPKGNYTILGGPTDLEVVGESFYQDALRKLAGSTEARVRVPVTATLLAEVDNQYDENAVSVWVSGLKVGHLSREDAATFQPRLLDLQGRLGTEIALPGVIAGGGEGRRSLGIFLNYDPAAFGLETQDRLWVQSSGTHLDVRIRTGFSDAMANDEEDDAYDLGWESRMPQDRLKAMAFLRQELTTEQAPISRHYMYAQLEHLLYGARDELASALPDYDVACEAHHAEMPVLRPALIAEFGGLPLLETYKQAAIRHQKAHDWQTALRWAEAGIAVYGTDALSTEFVDDLARRTVDYRNKLGPAPPRATRPQVAPQAAEPSLETLTCESCGRTFQRMRTRGRKPKWCPECRALHVPG